MQGSSPAERERLVKTGGKPEWYSDETYRRVFISRGYWLADTECTQQLWHEVRGELPRMAFRDPLRPVESIPHDVIQDWLYRFELRTGIKQARLPTEAEWEYACRAGTDTETYAGRMDWRSNYHDPVLDTIAWYGGNCGQGFNLRNDRVDIQKFPNRQYPDSYGGTHPVAQKTPNAWGLYDMIGNVAELTDDTFSRYDAEPVIDPVAPVSGEQWVYKGGAWEASVRVCRPATRTYLYQGQSHGRFIGFRVLCVEYPRRKRPCKLDAHLTQVRRWRSHQVL